MKKIPVILVLMLLFSFAIMAENDTHFIDCIGQEIDVLTYVGGGGQMGFIGASQWSKGKLLKVDDKGIYVEVKEKVRFINYTYIVMIDYMNKK